MAEVVYVATGLTVDVWLRGGWAMDFYLGEVTRRHEDVDWFAWSEDLPTLVDVLISRGWREVGAHPPEQQRDLVRDDVELGFATLPPPQMAQSLPTGGRMKVLCTRTG